MTRILQYVILALIVALVVLAVRADPHLATKTNAGMRMPAPAGETK